MISFIEFLLEKERTNTFTHDDKEYNLTKLNKVIKDNPVEPIAISKLIWIFKYDDPDEDQPERIKTANINVPIIVIKWEKQLVVLDGLHRLKKASDRGLKTLPARMVTKEQLALCVLPKPSQN
jgi:hypothetical protein